MYIELSKFIYNLIPGAIYFVTWVYLYGQGFGKITQNLSSIGSNFESPIIYTIFIIGSLFVGFLLNGIWRLIRHFLNLETTAKNSISDLKIVELDTIHQAHARLWYEGKEALSEHFSAIAAMWGNFFSGSLVTIILFSIFQFNRVVLISQLLILIVSAALFIEFKKCSYATIMRQWRVMK